MPHGWIGIWQSLCLLGQPWLLTRVNHAACTLAGKALPTKIHATYSEESQAAQRPARTHSNEMDGKAGNS